MVLLGEGMTYMVTYSVTLSFIFVGYQISNYDRGDSDLCAGSLCRIV
jgi:hypothetical protein